MWYTSNLRPLRIGEEQKKEQRKKEEETKAAKYNGLPYWAAIIIIDIVQPVSPLREFI